MENTKYITCPQCNTSFDKELVNMNQNAISCIYCDSVIYNIEKEPTPALSANLNNYKITTKESNKLSTLGSSALIIAIMGCLATTGIYQYRYELAEDPKFHPYVEKFCETLDCKLTKLQDVSKIMINNPKVLTDKDNRLAMILSANLENQGNSSQPYPNLQINFLNNQGDILYRQVYKPSQYLKNSKHKNVLYKDESSEIEIKFLAQDNSDATDLSLVIIGENEGKLPS